MPATRGALAERLHGPMSIACKIRDRNRATTVGRWTEVLAALVGGQVPAGRETDSGRTPVLIAIGFVD